MHPSRGIEYLKAQPASRLAVVGLAASLVLAGCGFVIENRQNADRITSVTTERSEGLGVLPEFDLGGEQKLLTGTWNYMIGAQQSAAGLSIHRSGEAIVS